MRRVLVTGYGVFVPGGSNISEFWNCLLQGKSQVKRIGSFDPSPFPTQIAAEISSFDPRAHFSPKDARRTDRYTQFAALAASQAVKDAGEEALGLAKDSMGVYEGSSLGPMGWFLEQHTIFNEKGYKRANPLTLAIGFPGAASAKIASLLKLKGVSSASTGGSVASITALASAANAIKTGELEAAVVVGSEAPISPSVLGAFSTVNVMSRCNSQPELAYKPFDSKRDGFALGEGAAAVVLESDKSAARRNAIPYAEIKAIASTSDSYHVTAPDPSGEQMVRAMDLALERAGLDRDMIDCFNAHGTGTRINDKVESLAVQKTFGSYSNVLPVVSIKGTIGHLLGACGLVEIVASILFIEKQTIPPTANLSIIDAECPLNITNGKPVTRHIENVMSNNYSFGGKNTSVIISSVDHAWNHTK